MPTSPQPGMMRFAGALLLPVFMILLALPLALAARELGEGLEARASLKTEIERLGAAETRLAEALEATLAAARLEHSALDMRLSRSVAERELASGLTVFAEALAGAPANALGQSEIYELPLTTEAASLAADIVFIADADTALGLLSGPALIDLDVMELELLALADGRIRVSLTIACRYQLEAGNAA
ncbi:hypothetical protein [Maricaulis sp.]|uniref:hypothetical protein n=1 Tax=Maricaulis sp. TaxID=1486257 RepID=UPI002627E1CF|nr:hypothetical protein [Maricaulis sp.]